MDESQLRAIQGQISSDQEPWYRAYQGLLSDAEEALHASPRSVVDNGAPAGGDDPHKFGTDAPYQGEDGEFSENANREDYLAALRMGNWIRDLGMGYAFSGRDKYAEKAIDLVYHWFVDPDTRMFPSAENYAPHTEGLIEQNSVEHYITIPKMLYGANFVREHQYWSTKSGDALGDLTTWVRSYLADSETGGHRGGPSGNDVFKWWLVNRAVAAAYLDDTAALDRCFDDWVTKAFTDYESRGTFEFARWRTRGLYYSFSAVNALVLTAEIARLRGVDLFGHEWDGVKRLQEALRYHAQFLSNPKEWQWQELDGLESFEREFGGVAYEVAYSHWQEDPFIDAIRSVGRPIYDQRVLGWATLTHGNLFELDS